MCIYIYMNLWIYIYIYSYVNIPEQSTHVGTLYIWFLLSEGCICQKSLQLVAIWKLATGTISSKLAFHQRAPRSNHQNLAEHHRDRSYTLLTKNDPKMHQEKAEPFHPELQLTQNPPNILCLYRQALVNHLRCQGFHVVPYVLNSLNSWTREPGCFPYSFHSNSTSTFWHIAGCQCVRCVYTLCI